MDVYVPVLSSLSVFEEPRPCKVRWLCRLKVRTTFRGTARSAAFTCRCPTVILYCIASFNVTLHLMAFY